MQPGMTKPMKDVLVLGIGNILLRDEGIGVHAVRAMQSLGLPSNVEAIDGGTSGADLVDIIAGRRRLVVVDAAQIREAAGTFKTYSGADLMRQTHRELSLHEFGLLDTLRMAACLRCRPDDIVILAVQPKIVAAGLELSPELQGALPRIAAAALAAATRAPHREQARVSA